MLQLNPTGTKILKILHLLVVMTWTVSIIAMWVLSWISYDTGQELFMYYKCMVWIDRLLTVPAAILSIGTGIFYGLLTPWGFFKQRWIIVKWIVCGVVILLASLVFYPACQHAYSTILQNYDAALNNNQVLTSLKMARDASFYQAIALIFLVVISVFKPWRKHRPLNVK